LDEAGGVRACVASSWRPRELCCDDDAHRAASRARRLAQLVWPDSCVADHLRRDRGRDRESPDRDIVAQVAAEPQAERGTSAEPAAVASRGRGRGAARGRLVGHRDRGAGEHGALRRVSEGTAGAVESEACDEAVLRRDRHSRATPGGIRLSPDISGRGLTSSRVRRRTSPSTSSTILDEAAFQTAEELARRANTSSSTVVASRRHSASKASRSSSRLRVTSTGDGWAGRTRH